VPSITDISGVRVGHATDPVGLTGCTVVLCEAGAVASCEVRGAAPGTRETDLLHPTSLIQQVHAVLLTGGSAFGLAAADGVDRYLEERGVGYDVGVARVPIVPTAVLFDLALGDPRVRPDATMGYQACLHASSGPVEEGSVGAGTGATVGKMLAMAGAMKGGIGSWSVRLADETIVGALVAVNALGDVIDDRTGEIIAGARGPDGRFVRTADALLSSVPLAGFGTNTTLAVIATNAALTKAQAWRLAVQGHAGFSRAIVPSHTLYDGDTVFVLATSSREPSPDEATQVRLGEAAARAAAEAVRRAVRAARGMGGVPGCADVPGMR
jgi:L-aminopeptidase/D-esterase-like protein